MFDNESRNNRFDRNDFGQKESPGPFLVFGQVDTMSIGDRVDLNYFHDLVPPAVNEKEAIRVGWSGVYEREANIVIERNLFENCDGDPEVISIKTHQNIVRHNTIRSSAALVDR